MSLFSITKPSSCHALCRSAVILALVVLLFVILRLSLPNLLILQITGWLHDQGIEASIADIQFDFTEGHFTLLDARNRIDDKPLLQLHRAEIHWRWSPLGKQLIDITAIELDSLDLQVQQYTDRLVVAGLVIDTASPPPPAESSRREAASNPPWQIHVASITLDKVRLCHEKHDRKWAAGTATPPRQHECVSIGKLQWRGQLDLLVPAPDSLRLAGNIELLSISLDDRLTERNLLAIDSLQLGQLRVDAPQQVTIDTVEIENLSALQRASSDHPETLSFRKLQVSSLTLQNGAHLAIDTVTLDDPGLYLVIDEQGQWEHAKWLSSLLPAPPSESGPAAAARPSSSTARSYSLATLAVTGKRPMEFVDRHVQPAMTFGLKTLSLQLHDFDSTQPGQKTRFKLELKSTRRAHLTLQGFARPLADKVDIDATGKLSALDLRVASPLVRQAAGHTIKSGQLDADMKLLATQGILDSKLSLTLHHFNLLADNPRDADALDKLFGMPINQSLRLLRDKDDSIHLDLPITGDIANPQFDPADAIIKATTKATTVALITFYTPYGLVYAGGNALFDLATAMDFEPVRFRPGDASLDDESRQMLNKLTTMLDERPQLHLTLCGFANGDDAKQRFPDTPDKAKPTPAQRKTLLELAEKRQQAVKRHLIEKNGIAASRLILCQPVFSQDISTIAGVEINI